MSLHVHVYGVVVPMEQAKGIAGMLRAAADTYERDAESMTTAPTVAKAFRAQAKSARALADYFEAADYEVWSVRRA